MKQSQDRQARVKLYRDKYKALKTRLRELDSKREPGAEKITVYWFWWEYITPLDHPVSYPAFSNIMRGRYDQERQDIIELIDRFLAGESQL